MSFDARTKAMFSFLENFELTEFQKSEGQGKRGFTFTK